MTSSQIYPILPCEYVLKVKSIKDETTVKKSDIRREQNVLEYKIDDLSQKQSLVSNFYIDTFTGKKASYSIFNILQNV